jgi:secretion/DNA translocation related CpaE-like protein
VEDPVTGPRPLLVAHDPDLLDDVLRAAAIAEVELDVAVDLVAARAQWAAAPLVLLDAQLAATAGHPPPARRRRLMLVCRGTPAPQVWQDASVLGAELVLALPAAERTLVERLANCAASSASRARVIGVTGGCGGAGATVFAASLALAAARRPAGAMLIDLDPFAGGVDLVMGLEECRGLRWPDLVTVSSRLSPNALHAALPSLRGLAVLSSARADQDDLRPEVVRAVLAAARHCAGFVVMDLPRPLSPGAAASLPFADDVLVVVPAEVRAIVAARRVVSVLRPAVDRIWAVVRVTAALSARRAADALALPLAGEMRTERAVQAAVDRGQAPFLRRRGPLSTLCDRLLDGWSEDEWANGGRAA